MGKIKRWLASLVVMIVLLVSGPVFLAACSGFQENSSWRTATRESAGIAPRPDQYPGAVIQVYGASAWSWRGYFSVHTWISTKEAGADEYRVHQVIGWQRQVVSSYAGEPDRHWFGAAPELYADIRGQEAAVLIPKIYQAIAAYPYPSTYKAWPGPNSNTFVSWVIREVDGLDVALPANAIGKDYLGESLVAEVPGGYGYQLSLGGYLGLMAGVREGLELNILGLSLGVSPMALGIKLPGVGDLTLRNPNPMATD